MPKINSNSITFVDITDSRKLEVYISSNLPTTQIKDSNTGTYSPDWSSTNLQLTADVYLDSEKVTPKTIQWSTKIGTTETVVGSNATLKITTNVLADNPIITYICRATYQNVEAFKEITFMRTDTGLNGSNGSSAPAVLAQYSADGATNWTSTLNTAAHKYIRHSYDGGKTWSVAIKMVGEDGTSVKIVGTAASATNVSGTDYYTLVYSSASITNASLGDAYLYDGDLYVCADSRDGQDYFINVGNIQGPSGSDGKSSYVFIRYATDVNGTGMSTSPSGKTYMGVYTSDTNVAPTTASLYTWSKFVGDSAKSIVLSGDSQVFKVSQANVITPSAINVTAHAFNTAVANWTYSTNGGQSFLSTVPAGVSRNGNIVTITGSAITSNSIVIKASDGTIEDVFTVYKAVDGANGSPGAPGDPAPIAFLTNENVTFSANAQGQITGTTITSNVVAYNGTNKVTPTVGTITGAPIGMTVTASTISASNEVMLTITVSNNSTLGSDSSNMGVISIPVTSPVSTVLYLTWSKVNAGPMGATGSPGAPAYTAMLTNESHIFAGDISNALDGSATTQVIAYKGATEQAVTLSSVNGKTAATSDTDTGIAGLKFKCSALSGKAPTITFTCTTSFVSANGTIPIVFTVDGVSFTKIFTYSIAFKGKEGAMGPTGNTGSTGAPATSYWLISSASVVQKTSTGTIAVTPSTITFTGKSQTGTATPADYNGRWIIDYSTDGTNYTNLYTSSANEASKSITVATTYKTIRARMYLAGGTATLLDEQIIPIVSDGAKGDMGNTGRGVSSITEQYYQSTSATAQSGGSWSATVPTWADGKYIWTRSVITYTDTTTSTTSPICITGQKGGTGVGVSSVDVWYYQSTSATALSGGSWSTTAPTWSDGKYVWTKTITTYTNSTTDETTAVCITGQKGSTGVGIKSVTEYYLATSSSSGVTTSTTGWTTTIQTITVDKKYLWNYEVITYTDNTTSTTTPIIIGVFGSTGKGIKSVTEYYLATTSSSGVTTATTGWSTTMQSLTATNKYLWNYELITYTDNTTATIDPVIIGVYGDKGDQGNQGPQGKDAYTVILTNESHVFAGDIANAITASTTTQVLAYKGTASQSVTIVSVNGKTASTSSTATGIAGLSFSCSALSGTSPTITFSCTTSFVSPSGTIPIVLTVDGVTITKMFTYSIAFKGSIGSQGSPGTPASLVDITPSAHYFKSTTGKDGTFTPDYIYLYPRFQTVTYSKWEYSTNGGTSWTTVTSGSNGLTIGTYNSVANSLQIAKTSALYTDSVTSISFRCVSSTASVYDTVSIAKIYDVVDLQIGGANLLRGTKNFAIDTTRSSGWSNLSNYTITTDEDGFSVANKINTGLTSNVHHGIYSSVIKAATGDKFVVSFWLKVEDVSLWDNQCPIILELYDTSIARVAWYDCPLSKLSTNPSTLQNAVWTYCTFAFELSSSLFSFTTGKTWSDVALFGIRLNLAKNGNISFKKAKLERGNKATDWSPAPEDLKSTTFQIYAPKGYLLTNSIQELTLETFAYDGSQPITNAAFVWSSWDGEAWIAINGATGASLTVNKGSVFKSGLYRCQMTYHGDVYTATATVDDKTDAYESLIRAIAKYSPTNRHYWILYATVYSEEGEQDALLGPISEVAPTNPATGSYWYKIDETNYTATLMKYSGTAWATTTDTQDLHYDWVLFKDADDMAALGQQSKVVVVTSNDFSKSCDMQCNIFDDENMLLSRNNQTIIDPSDPVISQTAPQNPVDGQLWIQLNNGSYVIYIWNGADKKWIMSEADSQNKVYVEKPTSYTAGDIWIVGGDYQPTIYVSGTAQTTKYLAGTMLKAQYTSDTYKDSDWVEALNYKKQLDEVADELAKYKQYISIDDTGLIMEAKAPNGQLSEFKTKLTNTELGFYQGDDKVAYINNNQLNISKAQITNGLSVSGTSPVLTIGSFSLIQEDNGSLSIITNI